MSHHRFDTLWKCICFSDHPSMRPEGMSFEENRWRLIDDLVKKSTIIERKYLHHQPKFVLENLSLVGVVLMGSGLIMGCQCMLQLTASHRVAVRSNILPMGSQES